MYCVMEKWDYRKMRKNLCRCSIDHLYVYGMDTAIILNCFLDKKLISWKLLHQISLKIRLRHRYSYVVDHRNRIG